MRASSTRKPRSRRAAAPAAEEKSPYLWIHHQLQTLAEPIDGLRLKQSNPRLHDQAGVAAIALSLERYGHRPL